MALIFAILIGASLGVPLELIKKDDASVSREALWQQAVETEKMLSNSQLTYLSPQVAVPRAYPAAAAKNLAFERELGKALIMDADVKALAKSIRVKVGAPSKKSEFTEEDMAELLHLIGPIGGADALSKDKDALDAHILAVHILLDRKENNVVDGNGKCKEAFKAACEDVYLAYCKVKQGTKPPKRSNRFNQVAKTRVGNPIMPWNCHHFDQDLFAVGSWAGYSAMIKDLITSRWDQVKKSDKLRTAAATVLGKSEGDLKTKTAEQVIFTWGALSQDTRKKFLHDVLYIKWSTDGFIADELSERTWAEVVKGRSGNPVSPNSRMHNTGNYANVVLGEFEGDPNVKAWVQAALKGNWPIISGPSGHSGRFINHYAEKLAAAQSKVGWPTLEQARLLMMANLLPPKSHHSYYEIMIATLGATAGDQTLTMAGGYEDIATTPEGKKAYCEAGKQLDLLKTPKFALCKK